MSTEPEITKRPPVRVWHKRLLLAGGLVVAAVALAAAHWTFDRYRAANQLAALVARLDAEDPGWKLDEINAARAELPEEQNSAQVVVAVAKLLPQNWPYWDTNQEFDPRRFENLFPPCLLDAESTGMLTDEMAEMAPALAQARQLAAMPLGKHKIEFVANVWKTVLNDQLETRRVVALLRYDALDLAQRGDIKGALLAGRASINASRSLGDEPTGISQLVRAACVVFGMSSIEQSLALGEAADADLTEVQTLLRLEGKHPTMLVGMRGERAMQHAMFDNIAKKKVTATEVFSGPDAPGAGRFVDPWFGLWNLNLPRQQLLMLEIQTELVEATKLPPQAQLDREAEIEKRVSALPRRDVIVKHLLPFVVKQNQAFRRKLGQARAMDALLATERYRLKNGKWPGKLEDIPKEMLPAVPLDPYDGNPVRYRRTADGVGAYVLGDDLKDDGGDVERPADGSVSPDWGYRLWDVNKRHQPPRPPAAKADDGAAGPGL